MIEHHQVQSGARFRADYCPFGEINSYTVSPIPNEVHMMSQQQVCGPIS